MGRRLLRGTVKLGIVVAIGGALVVIAKKLMGGLGPEPGSELAPKEWPSLVPDKAAPPSGNGNGEAPEDAATTTPSAAPED